MNSFIESIKTTLGIKSLRPVSDTNQAPQTTVNIPMPPVKPYVHPDAEFDIEYMKVFSIERMEDGVTCIGVIDNAATSSDIVFGEWYVRCSIVKHQDFVDRFRKKIKL
jgi:hypothetical protein